MHRLELERKLYNYSSPYPEEREFKSAILEFIKEHPDCFERSLAEGHITASCWLLNNDHSKALMMHHAKLGRWFQLGGHCDGNSNTLAVAVKEAQEESGIDAIEPVSSDIFDIDIHLIPANPKEAAHYHYDIRYLLQVVGDQDVVRNRESKELRWIDKDRNNLPTDNHSIIRMFSKWINR